MWKFCTYQTTGNRGSGTGGYDDLDYDEDDDKEAVAEEIAYVAAVEQLPRLRRITVPRMLRNHSLLDRLQTMMVKKHYSNSPTSISSSSNNNNTRGGGGESVVVREEADEEDA